MCKCKQIYREKAFLNTGLLRGLVQLNEHGHPCSGECTGVSELSLFAHVHPCIGETTGVCELSDCLRDPV